MPPGRRSATSTDYDGAFGDGGEHSKVRLTKAIQGPNAVYIRLPVGSVSTESGRIGKGGAKTMYELYKVSW